MKEPITKKGLNAIQLKLAGYEKKYGWEGLRFAVNKYMKNRKETISAQSEIEELESKLKELNKK